MMSAGKTYVHAGRRRAIFRLNALGLGAVLGTGLGSGNAAAQAPAACALMPAATAGPFPLLAFLGTRAAVRRDIRESRPGVPLTLNIRLQNIDAGCAPIRNAAVYVWHCDRDGGYSGYSNGSNGDHRGGTFLRGIQMSDEQGQVSFTTIFPGWYPGRITHIHFQVYLRDAKGGRAAATSQLAFPDDVVRRVYATDAYPRGQNGTVRDIADDGLFSGDGRLQTATVSGSVASGLVAALNVGVSAGA
ncbi:intradiol ring-cleavage dioxygenase [Noviherbaspirillum malthae]|uniref:intradiol ring-cleavage dioxygenase n=1 Tax=Noviherbaspirillum malthae TaxID=1260987 RepID=UPI00188DCD8F|nr:intradiol ring-cleavage dioxygenase [Noviherbaspirillum malthae]